MTLMIYYINNHNCLIIKMTNEKLIFKSLTKILEKMIITIVKYFLFSNILYYYVARIDRS